MAIPKGKKKVVACSNYLLSYASWSFNNSNSRISFGSIYLCNILIEEMAEKLKVKKIKRRIPIPQKPSKVIVPKKVYSRKKNKINIKKELD
jgi:hypothetical protein